VVGLNLADLSVMWTVALSSPATVIATSDDGSMAYAGLIFESAIQQINLASHSTVRTFALAPPDSGLFAFDIAVRPGSPETVAVAIGSVILIPTSGLPFLFVQGVQQPTSGSPHDGRSSRVAFLDASTLITIDNETTAFDLQKFSVADDGLTYVTYFPSACCGSQVKVVNGRIFSSSGRFFDPATLKPTKAVGSDTLDLKLFHPVANSVIQMFPETSSGSPKTAQLSIREYDADRGYLKRKFRVDEAVPGSEPTFGVAAVIIDAVATGPSSFAVLVGDDITGSTALLSYDLSAIAPLQPRTLVPRTAMGANVSAVSVSLPFNSFAYDPAADRIVATVQALMGPQGNSIAVVRPGDGVVERLISLPSEPGILAVSQSGSIAYTVLKDGTIQQVDLANGTLGPNMDIEFTNLQPPVFYPLPTAQFFPSSITVKPDDSQTFAIAGCAIWAGYECGQTVAVFKNGVQTGIFGPRMPIPGGVGFPRSDAIVFNGPAEILGFDLTTTTPTMQHFSYSDSGLSAVSSTPGPGAAKIGFGYAYSRFSLLDIQTGNQVGAFVPGQPNVFFFDAALLTSSTTGIGSYSGTSPTGTPALFFEQLTKTMGSNGSFQFSGQSRIRLDDPAFQSTISGPLITTGANRFVYGLTTFDNGTGVIYVISIP